MFLTLDMDSDIPIYTQLANELIEGIANGSLTPGDPLPSVRALAADLGINMHTVNKAYHELDKKDIIRIIPKSGAVVNEPSTDEFVRNRIKTALRPIIAEALAVGFAKSEIEILVNELIANMKEAQK